MDTVEFRIESAAFPTGTDTAVEPWVNGVPLRDLARAIELPFAEAEGSPNLAGGYAGLSTDRDVRWPSRHFLGEPRISWFGDGDTVLLGCRCGDPGCWPLTSNIVITPETVGW
ncbi:hypothetical protein [Frankia gtarii]|uniref:hypothetical protein n=1 Tax=Frankia gtarii TaxID=2950102 RepID=UPI0021C009B6|nr:hypothetical protein [Frankia gtarii]